jgi:hypothetical protein
VWFVFELLVTLWWLPFNVPRWCGGPNKLFVDVEFCKRFDWVCCWLDGELLLRRVINDGSICNELLKLGSDVERCKVFVIDVDISS